MNNLLDKSAFGFKSIGARQTSTLETEDGFINILRRIILWNLQLQLDWGSGL